MRFYWGYTKASSSLCSMSDPLSFKESHLLHLHISELDIVQKYVSCSSPLFGYNLTEIPLTLIKKNFPVFEPRPSMAP